MPVIVLHFDKKCDTIGKKQGGRQMTAYHCEDCENYEYDEECEDYVCIMDLDMDDIERLSFSRHARCPYYRIRDDYRIVRKQN